MGDSPQDLARDEYVALRATIRERGNLRIILFLITLAVWGGLTVAISSALAFPVASLISLTVLAAGFETVAALHLGVERIGRYVQVRFESDLHSPSAAFPVWERTVMMWGQRFPGSGTDPLFSAVFLLAALVNYLPVATTGVAVELLALGVAHVLFLWRIRHIRTWAARQRAEDLERFRQLFMVERG